MAKICPCQTEMKNESFLYFVYILDIFQMLPFGLFFMAIIGLAIYCKDGVYISGYHRCYAWFRLSFFLLVLMIISALIITVAVLKQKGQPLPEQIKFMEDTNTLIIYSIIELIWIGWNVYMSMGFLEAAIVEEKDMVTAVIVHDLEAREKVDEPS